MEQDIVVILCYSWMYMCIDQFDDFFDYFRVFFVIYCMIIFIFGIVEDWVVRLQIIYDCIEEEGFDVILFYGFVFGDGDEISVQEYVCYIFDQKQVGCEW